MTVYYNEIDPYAAAWLRNLIDAGHIAHGVVDERSIEDVHPSDLEGFTQCHFFAGVGVWSLALRRAGWPDDRPVWTGSCPCQPFSAAGQGGGFDDERHLWPHFHWLISQCRPAVVLGEQVASRDADPWIDLVCDDLEALGYAVGAVPFPSAVVGAPHIRDRLYWVADASGAGRRPERAHGDAADGAEALRRGQAQPGRRSAAHGLGNTVGTGLAQRLGLAGVPGREAGADQGQAAERAGVHAGGLADSHEGQRRRLADGEGRECDRAAARWEQGDGEPATSSELRGLADSAGDGQWQRQHAGDVVCEAGAQPEHEPRFVSDGAVGRRADGYAGPVNGFWRGADWLLCRDGRWRPVEPGTFPLAHGAAARVGRLRAYGNAINAEAARVFIESVMEL